jgi:23S rRNA (adenine2503-C2)-methyltransferase
VVRNAGKTDIKSLLFGELQEQLRDLGEPSYRAGQITDWLYKRRVNTIDKMTNLPRPLRTRLVERFSLGRRLEPQKTVAERVA